MKNESIWLPQSNKSLVHSSEIPILLRLMAAAMAAAGALGKFSDEYTLTSNPTGEVYEQFTMPSFLSRHLLFALFGGQVLSCLLCGTGVTSQALEDFYGIAVPTTQLFLVYLVMAVLFFPVLVMKRDFLDVLKENWWRYIILGLIDVEANYLVVLAYKYTTLTSIQVWQCIQWSSNYFTLSYGIFSVYI